MNTTDDWAWALGWLCVGVVIGLVWDWIMDWLRNGE